MRRLTDRRAVSGFGVRSARFLLLLFVLASAASVITALFADRRSSALCASIALAILAGSVAVLGRAVPARAWKLCSVGLAVLALTWAVDFWWGARSGGSVLSIDPGSARADVPPVPGGIAAGLAAPGYLLAVLALAASLRLLPGPSAASVAGRRQPQAARTTLVAALAVLLFGVVVAPLVAGIGAGEVIDVWADAWPMALVTVACFGVAVVASRRADHSWLVPAGAVLLETWAALSLYQLVDGWATWSSWWTLTDARGVVVSAATGTDNAAALDVVAGLAIACALGGAALLAGGVTQPERVSPTGGQPAR